MAEYGRRTNTGSLAYGNSLPNLSGELKFIYDDKSL